MTEEKPPARPGARALRLAPLAVVAVLVGGYFLFTLTSLAVKKVREIPRRATCEKTLSSIGVACHMYADENGGEFPPDFQTLVPSYVDNPKVFKCPSGKASWQDFLPGGTVTEESSSYVYVPGLRADMPGDFILAYDKALDNHKGDGRNVVFANAKAEWWPAEREAEFWRTLVEQLAAVARWRAAGARKEEMAKFLGGAAGPPVK